MSGHVRRNSGLSEGSTRSAYSSPYSKKNTSPTTRSELSTSEYVITAFLRLGLIISFYSRFARGKSVPLTFSSPTTVVGSGNEENLNPDAIFNTFRLTAQEIKKYDTTSTGGRIVGRQFSSSSQTPDAINNNIAPYYDDYSAVPVYANSEEQVLYLSTLTERVSKAPKE